MKIDVMVCSVCLTVKVDSRENCVECGGGMFKKELEVPQPPPLPSKTHQELVHEMMVALHIPLHNEGRPGVDNLNFDLLRSLVAEEAKEFNDAMVLLEFVVSTNCGIDPTPYWAEVIDAICDIDVVIHNASNAMGIDTEPFFQEVHRSNMAKAGGPTRPDGKKLKPEGWEPPRIKEMLKEVLDVKQTDEPVG